MSDDYEYPTEEQLKPLGDWDILKGNVKGLVEYIESLWWMPDWGFMLHRGYNRLFKYSVMRLELHTGGWSGNESIIHALGGNPVGFWYYWHKSIRGGHYWFEIPMDAWKKEVKDGLGRDCDEG